MTLFFLYKSMIIQKIIYNRITYFVIETYFVLIKRYCNSIIQCHGFTILSGYEIYIDDIFSQRLLHLQGIYIYNFFINRSRHCWFTCMYKTCICAKLFIPSYCKPFPRDSLTLRLQFHISYLIFLTFCYINWIEFVTLLHQYLFGCIIQCTMYVIKVKVTDSQKSTS